MSAENVVLGIYEKNGEFRKIYKKEGDRVWYSFRSESTRRWTNIGSVPWGLISNWIGEARLVEAL